MHWILRCIGYYDVLDITMHWILRCIGYYDVLDITMHWILRCIGYYDVLDITMHWILRCIGYHDVLDITMYWILRFLFPEYECGNRNLLYPSRATSFVSIVTYLTCTIKVLLKKQMVWHLIQLSLKLIYWFIYPQSSVHSITINQIYIGGGSRGGRTRRAPPLKLEKIRFFGVKSWFFTRNTPTIFAPPSAIGKNMIFLA